jgi:hypothetical protein
MWKTGHGLDRDKLREHATETLVATIFWDGFVTRAQIHDIRFCKICWEHNM